MAHIQTIKDDNDKVKFYRVFINYKDPKTGKYKKKSKVFHNYEKAKAWKANQENSKYEGTAVNPSEITVEEIYKTS